MSRRSTLLLALLVLSGPIRGQGTSTLTQAGTTTLPYGADGSEAALKPASLPSYAQVSIQGASTWTWESGVTYWYSAGSFTVTIAASGAGHAATFYMVDGDSTTRAEMIADNTNATIYAANSGRVSGADVSNFSQGAYQSFPLSAGANVFTFTHTPGAGANAVLTTIFFDTPTIAPAAAAPAHQVILNWTASTTAGVSSYNVYRNGAKLAALGNLTTYTDTTVQAGQTYSYTLTAVASGVESVPAPITAFTIPSP